jgi:hypothetical protein
MAVILAIDEVKIVKPIIKTLPHSNTPKNKSTLRETSTKENVPPHAKLNLPLMGKSM